MDTVIETKVRELLEFASEHGLSELAWQENGMRIAFRRAPKVAITSKKKGVAAPTVDVPPIPVVNENIVKSPIVGTFRRALSKDRPPVVLEGNHVKPGDRLGVVEAMKIPTDVVSFCAGMISKILVEDGQVVEYGQPLFAVAPNGEN